MNRKAQLFDGRQKAPILLYWAPVRYLLLPLAQKAVCGKVPVFANYDQLQQNFDEWDQNAFR